MPRHAETVYASATARNDVRINSRARTVFVAAAQPFLPGVCLELYEVSRCFAIIEQSSAVYYYVITVHKSTAWSSLVFSVVWYGIRYT